MSSKNCSLAYDLSIDQGLVDTIERYEPQLFLHKSDNQMENSTFLNDAAHDNAVRIKGKVTISF